MAEERKQGSLGITEAAFWESPEVDESAMDDLALGDFRGIVLDGPSEILLQERKNLPLVICWVSDVPSADEIDIERQGILCTIHLEEGEVSAERAFYYKGEPGDGSEPPEDDEDDDADTEPITAVSTYTRVPKGTALRPGTIVSRFLLYDRQSNEVRTTLIRARVSDAAVAEFLESRRAPAGPQTVVPAAGDPLPRYRVHPDSPPVPDAPGVVVRHERVQLIDEKAGCIVRGSFRVAPLPRQLVPPRKPAVTEGEPMEDSGWADVGDAEATAVIPVSLILTGDQDPHPHVVRLRVPSYDPVDPEKTEQTVTGHFSIDLLAMLPGFRRAQTYAVRALLGPHCTEATLLALVSPDMLPGVGE